MKSFALRHFPIPCCVLGLCLSPFFVASSQAHTTTESPTAQLTVETPAVAALPVIEPRAFEILRRADAIYKRAGSFSLQMQLRLVSPKSRQDDKFDFSIQAIPLAQQLRLIGRDSSGVKTVISDGQKVWRTHSKYKNEYSLQPFNSVRRSDDTLSQFEDLLKGAGVEGFGTYVFFNDRIASLLLAEELQSIRIGETTTYNGVAVVPVILTVSDQVEDKTQTEVLSFFFGQDDHLLRRTLYVKSNQDGYVEENYSNIRINPDLSDLLFTFKPAKNMKRVPSVDSMSREVRNATAPIVTSQSVKPSTKKPKVKPQMAKSRSN